MLNLINSIDIKKEVIKEPPVTKSDPLLSHTLAEIDYQMITACLVKSGLMVQVLVQPQRTSDEDVLRITMKFMITLMFKA